VIETETAIEIVKEIEIETVIGTEKGIETDTEGLHLVVVGMIAMALAHVIEIKETEKGTDNLTMMVQIILHLGITTIWTDLMVEAIEDLEIQTASTGQAIVEAEDNDLDQVLEEQLLDITDHLEATRIIRTIGMRAEATIIMVDRIIIKEAMAMTTMEVEVEVEGEVVEVLMTMQEVEIPIEEVEVDEEGGEEETGEALVPGGLIGTTIEDAWVAIAAAVVLIVKPSVT